MNTDYDTTYDTYEDMEYIDRSDYMSDEDYENAIQDEIEWMREDALRAKYEAELEYELRETEDEYWVP